MTRRWNPRHPVPAANTYRMKSINPLPINADSMMLPLLYWVYMNVAWSATEKHVWRVAHFYGAMNLKFSQSLYF